jgi:DNA-binding protein Fis
MSKDKGSIFNSGNSELSALWLRNPEQAVLECKLAIITEGSRGAAATKLGIDRRTHYRSIKEHPEIVQ